MNQLLKWLYIKEENGNIIDTFLDRETIESKLLDFNQKHYKKVMSINEYKDKIHNKLQDNETRNKILSRLLNKGEFNYSNVYKFLKLLKNPSFNQNNTTHNEITTNEWINIVKKAKKRSASSIFLSRMYAIYKYSLLSYQFTKMIINYHNILINQCYYLNR